MDRSSCKFEGYRKLRQSRKTRARGHSGPALTLPNKSPLACQIFQGSEGQIRWMPSNELGDDLAMQISMDGSDDGPKDLDVHMKYLYRTI